MPSEAEPAMQTRDHAESRKELHMELGIRGRTALVLGGGGGLGGAIAHALATEGVRIAVADIDAAAVKRSVDHIEANGGEAIGLAWDISDLTVVDKSVSQIEARFGPVD